MLSAEEADRREQEEKAARKAKKAAKAEKLAKKLAKKAGEDGSAVEEDTAPPAVASEAPETPATEKKRKEREVPAAAQRGDAQSDYVDQWITCNECGADFCFSASEQRFFREKGYAAKTRCSECTAAKKLRFGETSGKGTAAKERAAKTKCYICGNMGHLPKDCRKAPCYNCGQLGHKSKDCKEPRLNQAGGGVCFKFQTGSCTRGDSCRFAHIKE